MHFANLMLLSFIVICLASFQELYDENNGGGGGAEDSLKFVHGRLPEVSKCVCARAETLVEAVRGLEASINNCGGGGDQDALAAACSLQNDLRYRRPCFQLNLTALLHVTSIHAGSTSPS